MSIVITKTPLRVSFFGGGTDYPEWIENHGSEIISTTINKYINVVCMFHPEYYKYQKSRIIYKKIENIDSFDEIEHPVVKATLNFLNYKKGKGIDFYYNGDLPSKSGLGSSSAFAISCLNALGKLKKIKYSKKQLANNAIHIEQNILNETVGFQDQIACAYGGLNHIKISKKNLFKVEPIIISEKQRKKFNNSFILVNSGKTRYAHKIADDIVLDILKKEKTLLEMASLTKEAKKILVSKKNLDEFGLLLNETWKMKKELSKSVSNQRIDDLYSFGMQNGALGGKLLGAGSDGFMLFYVKDTMKQKLKRMLNKFSIIDLEIEDHGSRVYNIEN